MGPTTQSQETNRKISACSSLIPKVSDEARILIVCDDDSITERLSIAFREAGFTSECARSMTEGCTSARSGRFQVVFTTPVLADGSWRRLVEIAGHYDLGFEVVLAASTFDPNHWAGALEDGAFDVLDALHELPRAAEVAKCALWAAYLKGAGPTPEVASPSTDMVRTAADAADGHGSRGNAACPAASALGKASWCRATGAAARKSNLSTVTGGLMFVMLAALLFQFPVFAHPITASVNGSAENSSAAAEAVIAPSESPKGQEIMVAGAESEAAAPEALANEAEMATALVPGRLVPEPVAPAVGAVTSAIALASSAPIVPVYPSPARIHLDQHMRRIWLGLCIAQHSGAAFDAWTTRRVLSQGNAQELNPMLRPFAGNASLYAAVQVGPTIFDYLSRRMMTSRRGWIRHGWWIPQTVSAALSVTSGMHNLGVYNAR